MLTACRSSPREGSRTSSTTGSPSTATTVTTVGPEPATEIVEVHPVDAAGQLAAGYRLTDVLEHGTCGPGSEAVDDGYRCSAGNYGYDPCWRHTDTSVYCVADPWTREANELRVDAPLDPLTPEHNDAYPWGVEIGTLHCSIFQGAHDVVDGSAVDYYCDGDLALLRPFDRSTPTWHARKAQTTNPGYELESGVVAITRAIFG